MKKATIFASLACTLALLMAAPARSAPQAVAVVDDGYAGKVLNKIMETGKLKFGQSMELRLSLDDQGHLLECRASKGADSAAACAAAKAASPFGTPPYGVPTFVTLALWSDKTAKPQKESIKPAAKDSDSAYLAKVRRELRNAMYIPAETKPGTYHVTARIKFDEAGKILDYSVVKGSGDKAIDKYCLQGIKRAGKISPPPPGMSDSMDITFTLVRR